MKGQLKAIYFLLNSNVKNKGPSLILILAHITCTKQMEMIFLQLLREFNQKNVVAIKIIGLRSKLIVPLIYSIEILDYFSFEFRYCYLH